MLPEMLNNTSLYDKFYIICTHIYEHSILHRREFSLFRIFITFQNANEREGVQAKFDTTKIGRVHNRPFVECEGRK